MGLSVQQEIVYERLKDGYQSIVDANESMGNRAAVIIGGGTAIATFFGSGEAIKATNVSLVLLIAAAVASLCSFIAASFVWVPSDAEIPGSLDVDELWDELINESEDVAIANAINDSIGAIEKERTGNARRSRAFRFMLISVWFQVILVFGAVWLGK